MFKGLLEKLKSWVLSHVESYLIKEIDSLDRYEEEIVALIKTHVNADERAHQVVSYLKNKLSSLVEKAFSSSWLGRSFFKKIEERLLEEVEKLDDKEDDLAKLLRKHLNIEERAKLIVSFIQDYLRALVKKYINKI